MAFSVQTFFPTGEPVEVMVTGRRTRQGVVVGADAHGLGLVRVREYTPDGWRQEKRPRVEFLPWGVIAGVEPLTGEDIDDRLLPLFRVAGCRPDIRPGFAEGTLRTQPEDGAEVTS